MLLLEWNSKEEEAHGMQVILDSKYKYRRVSVMVAADFWHLMSVLILFPVRYFQDFHFTFSFTSNLKKNTSGTNG